MSRSKHNGPAQILLFPTSRWVGSPLPRFLHSCFILHSDGSKEPFQPEELPTTSVVVDDISYESLLGAWKKGLEILQPQLSGRGKGRACRPRPRRGLLHLFSKE